MSRRERDLVKEEILNLIDDRSAPAIMTKREAMELLEELSTDIDCRIDCLRDELNEEEG